MNQGDKKRSVTVRMTEAEYAYVDECAKLYDMSVSRFLRLIVEMTMRTTNVAGKNPSEIGK